MVRKIVSGIMLTLLLMDMLTLTFNIQPVKSESLTRLYISPESVEAYVDDTFTVDVRVADVLNLSSWKITLSFNFFLLEVENIRFYEWLQSKSVQSTHFNSYMNEEVMITVGAVYSTPISGSFELVTITFRAINIGNSTLCLHNDPSLINSNGLRIPHETSDGFVAIIPKESWMPRKVGVEVGDWALYDYNFTYHTDDPSFPMPPPPSEFFEIDQMKIMVKDIQDTRVTLQLITHYKNCTEQTIEGILDIHTGKAVYIGTLLLIAANLSAGDSLYVFSPPWNQYKINETISRVYVGVPRETLHFSQSSISHFDSYEVNMSKHIYWDRATGILTEIKMEATWVDEVEGYKTAMSVIIKMLDTNIWHVFVGDVNIDGKVDIQDIAIAAKAFGSYPGHSRWNILADINRDSKVDMKDLALIAANFGKNP